MDREKRRFLGRDMIPAAAVFFVGLYAIGLGVVFTTIYVNPSEASGSDYLGCPPRGRGPGVAAYLERRWAASRGSICFWLIVGRIPSP